MIVFTEKIAPPPSDQQTVSKLAERPTQDSGWVKNIIDGLAGILRDVNLKSAPVGGLLLSSSSRGPPRTGDAEDRNYDLSLGIDSPCRSSLLLRQGNWKWLV
jgi:hypothetical protein